MKHRAYNLSANMDPMAQLDAFLDEFEFSYLLDSIQDDLDSQSPTTTTTPLPPFIPAEQEFNIHSQFVDSLIGGHDGFTSLGAAPPSVEQPSYLYGPAGECNPGQKVNIHPQLVKSLSRGCDGFNLPGAAPHSVKQQTHLYSPAGESNQGQASNNYPQLVERQSGGHGEFTPMGAAPRSFEQPNPCMATTSLNVRQAAPAIQAGPLPIQPYSQGQYNNVPVLHLPEGLQPVAYINGVPVYEFSPVVSAPLSISKSKKRKQDNRPYIKKPANAFMVFMKEQRQKFAADLKVGGTARVNKILGETWKSLSKEEQAKYYEEAYKERCLHEQQHPNWTTSNNYGQKRKRDRSKAARMAEASARTSAAFPQQAEKLCVTPAHAGVMEAPHLTPHPHPQTPVTGNVDNMCPLPEVASTAVVSPAAPVDTETESCLFGISDSVMREIFGLLDMVYSPPPPPSIATPSSLNTDICTVHDGQTDV
ncbi:transcription factor 7-like [Sebastes umbrosus]|uniref:transcription factor 7-like n=1 Tax=Sebastes umbrosus TaxID=72105 RepID=UPI00189F3538|nr:transcription factor 7-like [Sebastes umbrosus]